MAAFFKTEDVVVLSEAVGLAFVVDDSRMVSACAVGVVHDMALVLPWSCRAVAHGVADAFRAAC